MELQGLQVRLFILFACINLFAGCTRAETPPKTLRLNYLTEVNSLDPRFGYEIPANHTVKMLYEGLMRVDQAGNLSPAAAESYTLDEAGRCYTFHIREACWSNGEPLTAYDFEYSWRSVINPELPTQGASDFYPIKNVEEVVRRKLPVEAAGVRALDAKTLVVELSNPAPYFLELLTTSAYSPVLESDPTATNGPFCIVKRRPHNHMVLKKNPYYWRADKVLLERIEISIIEDATTQLALFEKGESDWFGKPFTKLPLDAVPDLEARESLEHLPERAVYLYFLNTEKFPFTHPKMRRAFSLGMCRQEVVDHVLQEGESIATSVNPGKSYFPDGAKLEAARLFEEALLELEITRETFPAVRLSYCGIETNQRVAAAIQQQWQQTFGVDISLDPQEWTTYYDNLCSGNYLIGGLSWHARIRDPIYNLQLFKYSEDRLNISNWENGEFQALLDSAEQQRDPAVRLEILAEAEAFLMEQMPVIPIYFLTVSYAKNPQLKGVYLSELNEIDFTWSFLEPAQLSQPPPG